MSNYAKPQPIDRQGVPMFNSPPAFPAIATTARDNASTSSVTAFDDNTTTIAVTAVTTGAGVRWGNDQATSVITAAGTANFDYYVNAGETVRFAVPRFKAGVASVVGLNTREGLYTGVATKSSGVGSVLLTQY